MFTFLMRKHSSNYQVIAARNKKQYWLSRWVNIQGRDDVSLGIYKRGWRKRRTADMVSSIVVLKDTPRPDVWFLQAVQTQKQYRNLGLATILINRVIEEAKKSGAEYVIGWAKPIPHTDAEPNFDLFHWYAKWGFVRGILPQVEGLPHNFVLRLR